MMRHELPQCTLTRLRVSDVRGVRHLEMVMDVALGPLRCLAELAQLVGQGELTVCIESPQLYLPGMSEIKEAENHDEPGVRRSVFESPTKRRSVARHEATAENPGTTH